MIERNQGRTLREVLENLREITSREPETDRCNQLTLGRGMMQILGGTRIHLAEGLYTVELGSRYRGGVAGCNLLQHEVYRVIAWINQPSARRGEATFGITTYPWSRGDLDLPAVDGRTIIWGWVTSENLIHAHYCDDTNRWYSPSETLSIPFSDPYNRSRPSDSHIEITRE